MKEPACPECDKIHAVKDRSQAIGEFMEWLTDQGIEFARRHEHTDACYTNGFQTKTAFRAEYKGKTRSQPFSGKIVPVCTPAELEAGRFTNPQCCIKEGDLFPEFLNYEKVLARFFQIDLNKVEKEKRALLNFMREQDALRDVVRV